MYGVIGIFGAARYGDRTQGNILVNSWLGGTGRGGSGSGHSSLPVNQRPTHAGRLADVCSDLLDLRPALVRASSVSAHELRTNACQKDTLLDETKHFDGLHTAL